MIPLEMGTFGENKSMSKGIQHLDAHMFSNIMLQM